MPPQRTLLLTRPVRSSEAFLARLSMAARDRVNTLISPLMQIVPVTEAVDLSKVEQAIFTSANAVKFAPRGQNRPAYCVGQATTRAALDAGWQAEYAGQDADALIATIARRKPQTQLHHLAGRFRRGHISQRLAEKGIAVCVITLYDQTLLPLSAQARRAVQSKTIAPLFSPRTAKAFMQEVPDMTHVHVIALSEAVAEPMKGRKMGSLKVLDTPTAEEMLKRVEMYCLGTTSF